MDPETFLAVAGLILGLVAGVLLQRTHWCAMGAIADWAVFGSTRRLRAWALAVAVAVVGTQGLAAAGLLDLAGTSYLEPVTAVGALALGGLAFGFGMVLTGGCVSRSLARAGAGSLRSLFVLLVVALSAQATMTGLLSPLHERVRAMVSPELAWPGLAELVAAWLGAGLAPTRLGVGLLAAVALLMWALREPTLRRPSRELAAGLGLGLLVVAGWAVNALAALDPFAEVRPTSLSYVGPTARALFWFVAGAGSLPSFGAALALGTLAGAFAAARLTGSFRPEGFVDRRDLLRHLVGGVLMGTGGTLALGCTVGQGLTGLSTLSFGSLLAVGGIVLGARSALHWLETGRLVSVPLSRIPLVGARSHVSREPGDPA